MGLARGNVLPVEVAVEIDRGVDLLHDRIGPGPEASAPHFVAHDAFAAEVLPPMTEPSAEPYDKVRRRRVIAVVVWCAIAAGVVLAGVYGMGRLRGNPAVAACLSRRSRPRPDRAAGAGRGRGPDGGTKALPGARSRFQGRRRARSQAQRLARPYRAPQPLGDVVRALPQGNAGARRPRKRARRTELSRSSRSTSTPATRKSRWPFSRTSA